MRTDRPVFLYAMIPRGTTTFRQFFEPGDLKKIIENPGQLRPNGWDLTTRDSARVIKGEYLEVSSAERKRIRVYEDGSVFVRASGDEDFLSWGSEQRQFPTSATIEHARAYRIHTQFLQILFSTDSLYGTPAIGS